jgi:hypothetical protein
MKATNSMDKDMERVNFTIKMVVAMMASGKITKWKDLVHSSTRTILKPMRASGLTISSKAKASCSIKILSNSTNFMILTVLMKYNNIGNTTKVTTSLRR